MKKTKYNKELHAAARNGDFETLATLLEQGADINEIGLHGWPLLIHAVHSGDVGTVRFLLDSGANPDITDQEAKGVMHHAAMRGRMEVMRFLIQRGFAVDKHDEYGQFTPLHLLVAHAPRETDREAAAILLDAGAVIDARNKWGATPVTSAVFSGRIELVQYLLDRGANVNAAANSGLTLLMTVAQHGMRQEETARLLLDRGANVNVQDDSGETALIKAVWHAYEHEAVLNLLLDHGAAINLQDREGKTALIHAAMPPVKASLLYLLIKQDQESDKPDPDGKRQAQLETAWQRRASVLRLLLARGADPTICDAGGKTALDHAREGNAGKAVVEVLLKTKQ